ncbi:glycosyltransferase [Brevundimonas goettingensis]|uniref:Glycosyltransferase n=1 Tax=Brevundimonas goettingensis TaxID=2774190 RepID=A0A975GVA0_9CAUL|nr:glycosyltransferase [Brevundimonas goettingensis]QTC91167.1 glycosyltransferase [Brevundimonas goettingensis]
MFSQQKSKLVDRLLEAQAYFDTDRPVEGVTSLGQYVQEQGGSAAALITVGDVALAANRPVEAGQFFARALSIEPANAVLLAKMGDVAKAEGRNSDALTLYIRAHNQDPHSESGGRAHSILADADRLLASELPDGAVLFSIQDLFGYLKAHPTMSGIQRVQAGIAADCIAQNRPNTHFIVNDLNGNIERSVFWKIRPDDLADLIAYASGTSVDHTRLRAKLDICEANATAVYPGHGSTIILLGCFWSHGNTADRFITAKRAGARIGAYIYDIIPISHPEFCDAGLVRDFSRSVSELCRIVDFVLTISVSTRDTLLDFMGKYSDRTFPAAAVPLAHSLTARSPGSQWPAKLNALKGKPYVAYVSTIEGRKNHAYVVSAWRQLALEGVETPHLIFVGRYGWRIDGLMDLLDGTDNLDGKVQFVHDLTDSELNAVYEHCQFTVFTSYVEGWGLPVGESLMHGKPCVASNSSSIPEVGGDFVDYVDPLNLREGIETFRKMIVDADYLEQRRLNIVENFVPRSWEEVTADMLSRIAEFSQGPVTPVGSVSLPEGYLFQPRSLIGPGFSIQEYMHSPFRLLIADQFYDPEDHGAWMKGRFSEIVFKTDLPRDEEITVFIQMHCAPWHADTEVTIAVGGGDPKKALKFDVASLAGGRMMRLFGKVGADGLCSVSITVNGVYEVPSIDFRDFVLGLKALGYTGSSNLRARMDLRDAIEFDTV